MSYETVFEFISNYVDQQDDYKKSKLQESDFNVLFGFDDDGIINRMDLSSESLGYMSLGSEDMQKMIQSLR